MLQQALVATTASLTEKINELTQRDEQREKQTALMKEASARMESQRKRANDIGKTEGQTASLAR